MEPLAGPSAGRAPCHLRLYKLAMVTARRVGLGGASVEAERAFKTLKIFREMIRH